jgi:hypothetical protein
MGAEATCMVQHEGRSSEGSVLFETEALVFRGAFRLRIPFRDIAKADLYEDSLRIVTKQGMTLFRLGKLTSEKWLHKLLNPKSVLDKLGIKPDMRVAVLGIDDADVLKQLEDRVGKFERRAGKNRDCILWGVKDKKDLAKLGSLEQSLDRAGGIWAIWPKGKPELKEDDIRAAAIAAGFVDVKVLKFSDTHSGLRLVIPKTRR